MTAPIQRLPAELLCTIFLWHAVIPRAPKCGIFDIDSGPWPLTRVCRQWRKTAINYAPLWSRVSVDEEHLPILRSESAEDMLRTYLERSQACPLEVRFITLLWYRGEIIMGLLPILLSSSLRWRTAQISLRADFTDESFTTLFNTANFPTLDTLTVKAGFLREVWNSETFAKSFPCLQALEVGGIIKGSALPLAVEISSLTTLTLNAVGSLVSVPSSSIAVSSLHTLNLRDIQFIGTPLTLPLVHTATFTMLNSLEGLTLPSLRDLSITNSDKNSVDLFTQFLARSSCNIQKFHVGWRFIDLETALAQVPTVQHLDLIQWQGQSEDAEKTRFISSLQHSLLPSLQTLSLSLQYEHMVPFVFDVAQARCGDASESLSVLVSLDVYHMKWLRHSSDASASLRRIETIRTTGVEVRLHKYI